MFAGINIYVFGDHRCTSPVKLTLNVPMLFYIKRGILIYESKS